MTADDTGLIIETEVNEILELFRGEKKFSQKSWMVKADSVKLRLYHGFIKPFI